MIGKAHLLHFLLLCASFLIISSAVENLPDPDKPIAFFFFGDGVFDTGNWGRIKSDTNYNHPPYGITHFKIPTGRPSDGQLIADFIVQKNNSMLPPYRITPYEAQIKSMWRYGVSFATIKTYANSPHEGSPNYTKTVPFSKQKENFEQVCKYLEDTYGEEKTKMLLSKSIYIFSLGALDFLHNPSNNYKELGKTVDVIFKAYKEAIKGIYAKGGRKFAFLNIEPFKYTPYFKERNNNWNVVYSPSLFKGMLQYQLHQWTKGICRNQDGSKLFEGAIFTQFDYYQFLVDSIEGSLDRSPYENRHEACCGGVAANGELTCGDVINKDTVKLCENPKKYLWFDAIHPTDTANWYFTDQLWDNRKYASPFTLQDLYGNGNYTYVKPLEPEPMKPPRPQAEIARPPWMKNP